MKKLFTSTLALLIGAMLLTSSVFAEDVYVTKYGKKYHKKESRFIKGKNVEKLTREEAEDLGYLPSSDFKKDLEEVKEAETNDKQ